MTSCLAYYFQNPVPVDARNYKSMPKHILGEWIIEDGKLAIDKEKWVSIITDSNGVVNKKVEYVLSDSLVIKKYKQYFFINQLDKNGFWTLYVGHRVDKSFLIKRLGAADSLKFETVLGILPDSTSGKSLFYCKPIKKKQIKKVIDNDGFSDTLFRFDLKTRKMN
jgi:hypothetical protein